MVLVYSDFEKMDEVCVGVCTEVTEYIFLGFCIHNKSQPSDLVL